MHYELSEAGGADMTIVGDKKNIQCSMAQTMQDDVGSVEVVSVELLSREDSRDSSVITLPTTANTSFKF